MLSNCSRGTLMSYNNRSEQRKQPKPGYFRQFGEVAQEVACLGHLNVTSIESFIRILNGLNNKII